MRYWLIHLYLLGVRADTLLTDALKRRGLARDERGSLTIEQVAWAVAIIAIVAIAVAAIKGYVQAQTGKLG